MSRQVSNFIHVARWVAALAVLITHVNANALVVLGDIPIHQRGLMAYAMWFFYGFAHHAVVVFFVLSGFLVGGGVVRAMRERKQFLGAYLTDRTLRIYVVLVPVLLATAGLDAIGRSAFADVGAYADPAFSNRSGLLDLLANLGSLQDLYFPYFGTNSALWTLAHEYWYYVTFGLLAAACGRLYGPTTRGVCGGLGALLLIGLSASLSYHLFGFVLWLFGTLAASLARPFMRSGRAAMVLFLATILGLRLVLRFSLLEIWWIGGLADLAVALTFANLLLSLRFVEGPAWSWTAAPLHARLADFSYSLYALHMPLVIFLCAAAQHFWGFGFRSIPVTAVHWLIAAGILGSVVLLSYSFSRLTEARTQAIRQIAHGWRRERAAQSGGAAAAA